MRRGLVRRERRRSLILIIFSVMVEVVEVLEVLEVPEEVGQGSLEVRKHVYIT